MQILSLIAFTTGSKAAQSSRIAGMVVKMELSWYLLAAIILLVALVTYLLFRGAMRRSERQKRKLAELVRERTIHVEMQKEELKVQAENQMEINRLLKESREELLEQKKNFQVQAENLQEINMLLREKQEEILAQAEELELVNKELKKLNNTKDKLFSIIAHDLKNPFHAIYNFSDLLEEQYQELDEEKRKDYIKIIRESTGSAYQLLEQLLQWSRSQSSRIKVEPRNVNVKELINGVVKQVSSQARAKGVKIDVKDTETLVNADINMATTVLRNILSNAVKYSNKGDTVAIHVKHNSGMVGISVSDQGVGMDENLLKKLFNIDSKQSLPGTNGEKGTGLGLVISKEFAERNGGQIEVSSEQGKGSTFTFSLREAKK